MKWIFSIFCLFQSLFGEEVIPVVVVGSGPAGLSAALVTSRDRVETHVFTGKVPGGPVNAITCLGNWPGSVKGKGNVVMERLFEQVKNFGTHFHEEEIQEIDFSSHPFRLKSNKGDYVAKTVILATGATPRLLGVKGEREYLGKGIETYVYKTDAPRFEGKIVAVVGGGIDATKKGAIAAKNADKVYLIVRKEEMQKPFMEKKLKKKNDPRIKILYQSQITEIMGNGQRLTQIRLNTPSGEKTLNVDNLILAVGIVPNTKAFSKGLACDSRGYIRLQDRTQKTFVPGVFAAGTVVDDTYRQGAISAGDGMKAGYNALEFLEKLGQSF